MRTPPISIRHASRRTRALAIAALAACAGLAARGAGERARARGTPVSEALRAATAHAAQDDDASVRVIDGARQVGTLFTEHPTTTGAMRVEIATDRDEDGGDVPGEGAASAVGHTFGKLTGARWAMPDTAAPALDLGPLLDLGRELEASRGHPQDIEWAFADDRFHVLRTRDSAHSAANGRTLSGLVEHDRRRLLGELAGRRRRPRRGASGLDADAPVLVRDGLSALLPRPTPFSKDLMGRLREAGGAVDLACTALGVPYEIHRHCVPCLTTVMGWSYVNREEAARRAGGGPGALAYLRLARDAEAMHVAYVEEIRPRHRREMLECNAIAVDSLALDTALPLLDGWIGRFVTRTCVEVERVNIVADFHLSAARGALLAAGLDPVEWLGDDVESVPARAMALLTGAGGNPARAAEFLSVSGHRAPIDWEVASPRYSEDPALLAHRVAASNAADAPVPRVERALESLSDRRTLHAVVARARTFRTLGADAWHDAFVELAQIRRLMLAIGRLSGLGDDLFQLRIDELLELGQPSRAKALATLAGERRRESATMHPARPPISLSVSALERADLVTGGLVGSGGTDTPFEAPVERRVAATSCVPDGHVDAEDAACPAVFRLHARHAPRHAASLERRRLKGVLDDRRAAVRMAADDMPEPDRRSVNRLTNLVVYRDPALRAAVARPDGISERRVGTRDAA